MKYMFVLLARCIVLSSCCFLAPLARAALVAEMYIRDGFSGHPVEIPAASLSYGFSVGSAGGGTTYAAWAREVQETDIGKMKCFICSETFHVVG
jgi:hypothetical protein